MLLLILLGVLCQLNRSSHGHPIMGGADTPFQVTARRLRLRNVGTTAFRSLWRAKKSHFQASVESGMKIVDEKTR